MDSNIMHFDISAGIAITMYWAASCLAGKTPKAKFYTLDDVSVFLSILDTKLTENKALGDKKVFSHPKFKYIKTEMENDSYKALLTAMQQFATGCFDFEGRKRTTDFCSIIRNAQNQKRKYFDEDNSYNTYLKLAQLKYNYVSEYSQARFNSTCLVISNSDRITTETGEALLEGLTLKLKKYYDNTPNPYESHLSEKKYVNIDSEKFIKSIKEAAVIFNEYCDKYINIDDINASFNDDAYKNYLLKQQADETQRQ